MPIASFATRPIPASRSSSRPKPAGDLFALPVPHLLSLTVDSLFHLSAARPHIPHPIPQLILRARTGTSLARSMLNMMNVAAASAKAKEAAT